MRTGGTFRLTGVLAGAALFAGLSCRDTTAPIALTDDERAVVYATVARQIFVRDDTSGGQLRPRVLYLLGATDDRVGGAFQLPANSQPLPSSLRSGIASLLADLPTSVTWIEARDEATNPSTHVVRDGGAIVEFGNVSVQGRATIHIAGGIYVAPLAAGGQTYVLKRVAGTWSIVGTTGLSWISK